VTDYLILKFDTETGTWKVSISTEASSARRALSTAKVEEGEYVAIPARSWKPLTVKVETTTKTTIE
jgi:hypothetical protein